MSRLLGDVIPGVSDLPINWSVNSITMCIQYKLPHLPFLGKELMDFNSFCYKLSLSLIII